MSVTTIAPPVSRAVLQALADYDVHHTGNSEQPGQPEPPNAQPELVTVTQNPEDWDTDHRRVPNYRAVDPSRRGPERPDGVNAVERTFIYLMLNGVNIVAVRSIERDFSFAS